MNAHVRGLLFVILATLISLAAEAKEASSLNFSLLVFNGEQRNAYLQQVRAFEKEYPSISVNIQALESEQYKNKIESWLASPAYSDVMFWFGGERLNWYIKKGWVTPIDSIWSEGDWYNRITLSAQSSVLKNGRMYGLPIHYYHWGVYYKKSLFKKLDIRVPLTWKDLLQACDSFRQQGIAPIALGSSEAWPLAGWFDYLNLRINGLEFHQRLMGGDVSYQDPRVVSVFTHWKELIDRGCFLEEHQSMRWREVLPYLYRNLAGMFLMGNFWTSQIPFTYRDEFSLFRFPVIDSEVPLYEEAPTDVLFIPSNAVNKEEARKFIEFMARPAVQKEINASLGMLAPINETIDSKDQFVLLGRDILNTAEGASQFYDRDNPLPIAIDGMKLMQQFMQDPSSLPDVIKQFEVLRDKSFN
jgi:multiple sugar transport system substrate-binding protein